ncbi:pyridoxamine phosphate oxidase family [Pyrenophora seminiperda CCB06]|uniref:Pyridoxamine phosphate oxidase family n=1 Tax=Pyrenophora seminiperda CCB06 TaxID=1302712 RepID=A0A3M7M310_9PLEO|nr:pyridoxamine phosphate oxidase family [Pyrenophora seminiperda CCB06]
MGVYYETIPPSLHEWILAQQLLFVATAPLSPTGHINVSPKGGSNFGILSPTQFWYMDLTGSGVETHAHLHEPSNGRICVMFLAFSGPPKIVRIWGTGRAIENGTAAYSAFVKEHSVETIPGSRSIIMIDVHQCGTSCGFSVPYYDFVGHRDILNEHFRKKEDKFKKGDEKESMDFYWAWKSQRSLDGLPGMKRGVEFAEKNGVKPLKKMVGRWAPENRGVNVGGRERLGVVHLVLVLVLGVVMGAAVALSVVTPEGLRGLREMGVVF